ncbi:MAG: 16S rRNA (uracil(1498)-N(3))-methyltransferase [Deltaproteobacteria bacterium]|nr:MAG: 16S rRNA (uracil(1498)-N(3))-methyltransferase [Deltaproteobacteria bacterium]
MNLILYTPADRLENDPNRIRLSDKRLEHMRTVHRVKVGDTVTVGLLNGDMGTGRIDRLTADSAVLSVTLSSPPPPPSPITLVLAMPRPKMFRRVLAGVVSMGIKAIYLIHSYRVEKSYWSTPFLHADQLHAVMLDGLSQSVDTRLPRLHPRKRFKPFVEDELAGIRNNRPGLLAHPGATAPCPFRIPSPVTLVIGPEGGFIPYEVEKISAAGFTPVHIGSRILRVETAVPYLMGRIAETA